ncbi:DUF1801 domain-containing protein [Hydrogenoanaerobacterium saccharovorans]|nr:DUF1801 domain-containing protein [Hydrogenoanaerobacterium saccharovorans]
MANNKLVDEYINSKESPQRDWLLLFIDYMRTNYPQIEETISYQMPTYILEKGKNRNYIAFGTPNTHFTLHTMDFDYIQKFHEQYPSSGKGKGCVNVDYSDGDMHKELLHSIDEIIKRHFNRQ